MPKIGKQDLETLIREKQDQLRGRKLTRIERLRERGLDHWGRFDFVDFTTEAMGRIAAAAFWVMLIASVAYVAYLAWSTLNG